MGVGTPVSRLRDGSWLIVAVLAMGGLYLAYGGTPESSLAECLRSAPSGEADAPDPDAGGDCAIAGPETFLDLSTAARSLGLRVGADTPGDFAESPKIRARAARSGGVPGTQGRWRPVGKGPLIANDPAYPGTYGEGFADLAGRISDYSYDAGHRRLYAAVASGGVWVSKNTGANWRSIGDRLPTQTVGSVAYSPAHHGTVIAVTGDNAFGGNTYGGLGVFRTTNNGRTWRLAWRADRSARFQGRGRPAAPQGGLRGDRRRALPLAKRRPFLQGRQAADRRQLPGNDPSQAQLLLRQRRHRRRRPGQGPLRPPRRTGPRCRRLAGRGRPNFNGAPESPANGLYLSANGKPGTYRRLDVTANGFAAQDAIGRVELGAATGPDQNHGYVYALVQDAELFNSGKIEGLDVPSLDPLGIGIDPSATPTYLNGVYVSKDFGRSWTEMESGKQFLLPTSGSTLAQLLPLGFGPGIQSWYDEWIRPDPTAQTANGVPTRVVLGLEELYENLLPVAQDGVSDFRTIGAYQALGGGCLLVIAAPICSDVQQITQATTTHPDQHSGTFIPDGNGGVTLVAGNDGGNYTQHIGSSGNFSQPAGATEPGGLPHAAALRGQRGEGRSHLRRPAGQRRDADRADGTQNETFGGDGVFTQVDPRNSNYVFEEAPDAGVSVSTDGGVNWTDINPLVDNASFYSPLVMDPKNSNHVLTGGKQIVETTDGPNVTSPSTTPRPPTGSRS